MESGEKHGEEFYTVITNTDLNIGNNWTTTFRAPYGNKSTMARIVSAQALISGTILKATCAVLCPQMRGRYDRNGKQDFTLCHLELTNVDQQPVGWYCYRGQDDYIEFKDINQLFQLQVICKNEADASMSSVASIGFSIMLEWC